MSLKSIGGWMFFFGVGSAILYFLNMEFIVLMWMDMFGPVVGWLIRGLLAVVGGVLWMIGGQTEGAQDPS